jgi:hypothetical protein
MDTQPIVGMAGEPMPSGGVNSLSSTARIGSRAQFRIDTGLSPTFEELNRSFRHEDTPSARLSYRSRY